MSGLFGWSLPPPVLILCEVPLEKQRQRVFVQSPFNLNPPIVQPSQTNSLRYKSRMTSTNFRRASFLPDESPDSPDLLAATAC